MKSSSAHATNKAKLDAAGWLPRVPWSGRALALRQGDLLIGHYHQLRAKNEAGGPGRGEGDRPISAAKVPWLPEYEDVDVRLPGGDYVLRVWRGWMMVIEQTCELDHKDAQDSRLLVAPVAFRDRWPGAHWANIVKGLVPGYMLLPPISETEQQRWGARGWPLDTDAAIVLASACVVSRSLAPAAVFGLSNAMRAQLQRHLVDFLSVRGWLRSRWADTLVGKTIESVDQTGEQHAGPGALYKLHLSGPDDEATVSIVLG